MPAQPPERQRLAELMEERRLELGRTWQQVAQAGGIGYETIRAARNESSGIRKLTRAAIERGLRWEPGSVDHILAGDGGPVPLPAAPPAAGGARRLGAVPAAGEDERDQFFALLERVDDQELFRSLQNIGRSVDADGAPRSWRDKLQVAEDYLRFIGRYPGEEDSRRPGSA